MPRVVPPLTQSWLTPGTKKYYGSDSVLFPRLSHRRHHHFLLPFSGSLVLRKPAAMLEECSSSAAVRKGIEGFHWQPSSTCQSQERGTLEAAPPAPGKPSDDCSPGWHWQAISWETLSQNCQATDFLTCRNYKRKRNVYDYIKHLSFRVMYSVNRHSDAGKDWGQDEKGTTEDEIVGWHHWLNGHEFDQSPIDSKGQGSLVCCSPWVPKSDMT